MVPARNHYAIACILIEPVIVQYGKWHQRQWLAFPFASASRDDSQSRDLQCIVWQILKIPSAVVSIRIGAGVHCRARWRWTLGKFRVL